jgi:hypothetical protein
MLLLLYVYKESFRAKINLSFFNKFGMYRKDVEYCLIINGGECSVELNDRWKRKILRENVGYDFGGWKEGLESYDEKFDYYFFVNDTVLGPLGDRHWMQTFIDRLDETTKLCGISINCFKYEAAKRFFPHIKDKNLTHVQTMIWCTDNVGIEIVKKIFEKSSSNKEDVIINKEVKLSVEFLKQNYNITCLLPPYQLDHRGAEGHKLNENNRASGDVWHKNCYFGRNVHPLQSVFFKTNRFSTKELEDCIKLQEQITYY